MKNLPDRTVAQRILNQLGGNRFIAMTGATSFSYGANVLSFKLPSAKQGIRAVVIELTPADVYRIKFFARKPFPECVRLVEELEDVYCDNLRDVFERVTGLATQL